VSVSPPVPQVASLLWRGWKLTLRGEPVILAGGEDNLNLHVVTDRGDFVLRRYDLCMHWRTGHELALVSSLASRGFPTPEPIARRQGGRLGTWHGRPVAVFAYIAGEVPKSYDSDLAVRIGSLLGRLHVLAAGLRVPLRSESDPAELRRALTRSYCGLKSVGDWRQTVRVFLAREGNWLSRSWRALPRGVVHHDLHRLNLLVNRQTKSCTLLDCGEARIAPLIVDIARVFHYIAAESPGRRLPGALREALLQGYGQERRLSDDETEALARYFALVSLADAARFLKAPPDGIASTEDCRSLAVYRANQSTG
jgi:homoserine kinase type II